jgi:D-3-phosphoglycerate dehydrogenase
MVNAPVMARERDISVSETKRDGDCDYQTLIRVTVNTERGQRSVAGTLFGGTKPRVVEIKGIQVEAELGPHMLYITNRDKPGLIGRLGSILAEAGVNIATFHLGRAKPGGDAIALIELDQPMKPETLKQVRALDLVERAEPLRFDAVR